MLSKLNGWQRIGAILSVVWFFAGGLWGNSLGIHEGDWAVSSFSFCLNHDAEPHMKTPQQCSDTFEQEYVEAIKYHWWYALFLGLVPIPIGWGLAYGSIGLVRWVRRGFLA